MNHVHAEDRAERDRLDREAAPDYNRVIIPQYPTEVRDGAVVKRRLDLRDAQRYGELVEALEPNAKPFDPDAVDQLDQVLAQTSDQDFILAIGNPTLIAVAAAAFATIHGSVRVLQWQSRQRRYEAVEIVFTEEGTQVRVLTEDVEKK